MRVKAVDKNFSKMIKTLQEAIDEPKQINGQFRQNITINCNNAVIKNDKLDFEFSIPFDDDTEPNEAEFTIYNLSDTTIEQFKNNAVITVIAGYQNDTGVIFSGRISNKKTRFEDTDKITKIYAIDDVSLKERNVENVAYAAGVKASYVLRDLVNRLGLPIAIFSIRRDVVLENETTIDGSVMESIKQYAEMCGVSAYILKGNVYVQDIRQAKHINFTVSENTGLIGTPEEFEEETESETIKGYNINMLLQHRMQTGAVINLTSRNVNGKFAVRKGQHTYDGLSAVTEIEVIE